MQIACLGISFKPNIDDLRESPALQVVLALLKEADYEIIVVEPNIKSHEFLRIERLDDAIKKADLIVILVNHNEFIDLEKNELIQGKQLIKF